MFYYLSHSKTHYNDDIFKKLIEMVENVYWPNQIFQTETKAMLSRMTLERDIKNPQDAIYSLPKAVAEEIGIHPVYPVLNEIIDKTDNYNIKNHMILPFMDRFYSYFLIRNWTLPYNGNEIKDHIEELINLTPIYTDRNNIIDIKHNFSKNFYNYYHFVNVVAVVARLIMMFKDKSVVKNLFNYSKSKTQLDNDLDSILSFDELPNKRTFILLLSAFYHDIGKTIVDPRHGMEGSIIVTYNISNATYRLDRIWREYNNNQIEEKQIIFDSQDVLRISDFVYYHDQYGTLATGEDGYLRLVELVKRIKRHALKYGSGESYKWSSRYIFDLWLLNVADIITSSQGNKYEKQTKWLNWNDSKTSIEDFLNEEIGRKLKHDLIVSLLIVQKNHDKEHSDSTKMLQDFAYDFTINHSLERIRRLASQSLKRPLERKIHSSNNIDIIAKYLNCFSNISEQQWAATIAYCAQSVGDTQEFCNRLSWIGKMDYALGFFEKIAERILDKTIQELNGGERTKFIKGEKELSELGPLISASDDIKTIQSRYFSHNFATIVILIINHVLLRYERINNVSSG